MCDKLIFDLPNMLLKNKDWKAIIANYVMSWVEEPLSSGDDYNIDRLKFYDGLLGYLLKETERYIQEGVFDSDIIDTNFMNSWLYRGPIYRVLHKNNNGNMPKVNYHGMIGHWTKDYHFGGLNYKLDFNDTFIVLKSDTGDHIGFDVTKYIICNNLRPSPILNEREIIYPMIKRNVTEYKMSINEFIRMMESEDI